MSQNTSIAFHKPPNSYIRAQTPSNEEVDITVEEGGGSSTKKKKGKRLFFSIEEDKLVISSWLNVSLNSIVNDGK